MFFKLISGFDIPGTDYYAILSMPFLASLLWFAKRQGVLRFHAGARKILARNAKTGKIKKEDDIVNSMVPLEGFLIPCF